MLQYHVFGGNKEALMQLEREGSVWYWGVFTLDWALMTAGAMGAVCVVVLFWDALQHINFIMTAMRYESYLVPFPFRSTYLAG